MCIIFLTKYHFIIYKKILKSYIPKIRFYHKKFSIRYKGTSFWNYLNTSISSLTNLNTL